MLKFRNFLIIFIIIFAIFRLWQSTGCRKFADFTFSKAKIIANVEKQVNADTGGNRNLTRIFHNKVTVGIHELAQSYLGFFTPRFLFETISPFIVILALFSQAWGARSNRRLSKITLMVLVLPLLVLFKLPTPIFLYLMVISWALYAIHGTNYFPNKLPARILTLLLIPLTFWYFSYSWQITQICNEIFFR